MVWARIGHKRNSQENCKAEVREQPSIRSSDNVVTQAYCGEPASFFYKYFTAHSSSTSQQVSSFSSTPGSDVCLAPWQMVPASIRLFVFEVGDSERLTQVPAHPVHCSSSLLSTLLFTFIFPFLLPELMLGSAPDTESYS